MPLSKSSPVRRGLFAGAAALCAVVAVGTAVFGPGGPVALAGKAASLLGAVGIGGVVGLAARAGRRVPGVPAVSFALSSAVAQESVFGEAILLRELCLAVSLATLVAGAVGAVRENPRSWTDSASKRKP